MSNQVNEVVATDQEKGILKGLIKNRLKTWIKQNVSEDQMRTYMKDKRWIYIMSQRTFAFQKKHF